MGRARVRRIILPDALSSPSRRPGPRERLQEDQLSLADALSTKELLSQWTPGESPDSRSELQLRVALARTLADHASFGYIREGSKLPRSHPRPDSKLRFETETGSSDFLRPNGTEWLAAEAPPCFGNWSVIPNLGGRLLIFDLDVRKLQTDPDGEIEPTGPEVRYLEVRRSIAYLEKLLGMKLRSTYAQLSPSGGVHLFLLLPEGVDPLELPAAKISDGMRALAGIPQESWAEEFRGDIRSGASNGFILMAGSSVDSGEDVGHYRPLVSDARWSDFKDYRSGRKLRLLELTPTAVERLREARRLDLSRLAARSSKSTESDRDLPQNSLPASELSDELKSKSYGKLLQRLRETPPSKYHEARAQIYRALSCCSSPRAIADLCRSAGYARDSGRSRELSEEELLADMEAMERRGLRSTRCGAHCPTSSALSSVPTERELELEAILESSGAKEQGATSAERSTVLLGARAALDIRDQRESDYGIYGTRKPRGLNYSKILLELKGANRSSSMAGYRLRALELMVGYFGPLFAAGAPSAIASSRELCDLFGYSPSQLREALRFLRECRIIELKHRQTTGRASTYAPGKPRFYDSVLSRKLLAAWGESRIENAEGEVAFLGGHLDYLRGRIVRPDGSSFTDGYLLEVGGGFLGLLQEFDLDLSHIRRLSHSVVRRYLRKSLARFREISEPAADTVEPTRALSSEGGVIRRTISPTTDFSGDVGREPMPQAAPRKDRAAGNSLSSPDCSSTDRSPPDLPEQSRAKTKNERQ